MNYDLWLILIGPAFIAGAVGFVWLIDHFFGDCRHEWSEWQHFTTDYAYVQHRECTKCKFIFTEQLQKLQPPQEKVK